MGFRFSRRMNIAPGIRLNFRKSGISPSFGVRGARIALGRSGVRKTVGIPGTGLFYAEVSSTGTRRGRRRRQAKTPPPPQHRLDLGFFERLLTLKDEQAFVDGCKEYVAGRASQALTHLRQAVHLADGAFLAGFLALEAGRFAEAAAYLKQAAARPTSLGKHFAKYGLNVQLSLPITEEVTAHITPSRRGALLGLVEAYQRQGEVKEALECLKQLRRDTPDDVVVNLSMAELVYEAAPNDKRLARQIVALAGDVKNESCVHAALMLYKATALRTLGLNTAAGKVLTAALRKKRGRSEDLLRALRYERACLYEDLGQTPPASQRVREALRRGPGLRRRSLPVGASIGEDNGQRQNSGKRMAEGR